VSASSDPVLNRHGNLVFPSSYVPELDFALFSSLDQFADVISRDFEAKAPTATEIIARFEAGGYPGRAALLRDLGIHLFWVNRYSLTMYDKRPTRWRDVPRKRDDVFLPVVAPWNDGQQKIASIGAAFEALPATWDADVEGSIFGSFLSVLRHKLHLAKELSAIKPTVADALADPSGLTFAIRDHDPDYPTYADDDILDTWQRQPELEALDRWAKVLHNQYPWNWADTRLVELGTLEEDDFVVLFRPRSREISEFIRRIRTPPPTVAPSTVRAEADVVPATPADPVRPYPPITVRKGFPVLPRIESLAAVKGEHAFTNDDVIRNAGFNWSPMSAEEIFEKTGIHQRLYTVRRLEHIALQAASSALATSGRSPADIGAVVCCTCTSDRLIPSMATWISAELGIYQTHASFDIVAACAGFSYGLAEAVRLLQEVDRPVLVVFAEKFSDKIGNIRTSRMIFGDGAAAVVVGPAEPGADPDIEVIQTYASGPIPEVNSIIWPNPLFDGNITVYGPKVKALVSRYLRQMMDEVSALRTADGGSVLSSIDLIIPHQANRTMVVELAETVGIEPDRLYFNIEDVGNASAASIPLAIYDAVAEGVIDRPMTVFTPGFGAGAVAGYSILRVDPAVVVAGQPTDDVVGHRGAVRATSSDDVAAAFGA
jgi:3-oxoacyl-(acyl-carrier-protein) synthase III